MSENSVTDINTFVIIMHGDCADSASFTDLYVQCIATRYIEWQVGELRNAQYKSYSYHTICIDNEYMK